MVLAAPSLLAANFRCLADEVQKVEQAGADWLHLGIMKRVPICTRCWRKSKPRA